MEIGVRDLRNYTSQVIEAVRSGERVTLTLHGEPVADIVPHVSRGHWISGPELSRLLQSTSADPGLTQDLAELAGDFLDPE